LQDHHQFISEAPTLKDLTLNEPMQRKMLQDAHGKIKELEVDVDNLKKYKYAQTNLEESIANLRKQLEKDEAKLQMKDREIGALQFELGQFKQMSNINEPAVITRKEETYSDQRTSSLSTPTSAKSFEERNFPPAHIEMENRIQQLEEKLIETKKESINLTELSPVIETLQKLANNSSEIRDANSMIKLCQDIITTMTIDAENQARMEELERENNELKNSIQISSQLQTAFDQANSVLDICENNINSDSITNIILQLLEREKKSISEQKNSQMLDLTDQNSIIIEKQAKEIDSLKETVQNFEHQKMTWVKSLFTEKEALQSSYDSCLKDLAYLKTQMKEQDTIYTKKEQKLKLAREKEVEKFKQKHAQLEKMIEESNDKLKENDSTIENLQKTSVEQSEEIELLTDLLKEAGQDNEKLKQKIEENSEAIDILNEKVFPNLSD
jgi:chromosome segregation ATPase